MRGMLCGKGFEEFGPGATAGEAFLVGGEVVFVEREGWRRGGEGLEGGESFGEGAAVGKRGKVAERSVRFGALHEEGEKGRRVGNILVPARVKVLSSAPRNA